MYLSVSLLIFFLNFTPSMCNSFPSAQSTCIVFSSGEVVLVPHFLSFSLSENDLILSSSLKAIFPPTRYKILFDCYFLPVYWRYHSLPSSFFYCYWEISCHFHLSFFWRQSAFISFFLVYWKFVLRFVRCEFLFNHPGLKFIQLLPFQIINLSSFFLTDLWLPACSYF